MTCSSQDSLPDLCQWFSQMNAEKLAQSVAQDDQPAADLAPKLQAMWLAKKGRWHEAHDLCQKIPSPAGAWIHAWLHRQEGDYGNACYWYAQAGKPAPKADASLEQEWIEITNELTS